MPVAVKMVGDTVLEAVLEAVAGRGPDGGRELGADAVERSWGPEARGRVGGGAPGEGASTGPGWGQKTGGEGIPGVMPETSSGIWEQSS
jgi:hypothetical protein